jgi:hypothetical protein
MLADARGVMDPALGCVAAGDSVAVGGIHHLDAVIWFIVSVRSCRS